MPSIPAAKNANKEGMAKTTAEDSDTDESYDSLPELVACSDDEDSEEEGYRKKSASKIKTRGKDKSTAKAKNNASSDSSDPEASIPTGALLRALKFGKICDKRVKVSMIGPDRVGKTSLGKSLRGEPFNPEEPSTDGVQMSLPVKNAGTEPWKNLDSHQHTTAFDHKCAEMIVKEKQATEQQPPSEAKKDDQEIDDEEEAPQIDTPVPVILGEDLIKSRSKQIAALMEDGGNGSEEVWPVIWDFAGQAVYHAIHPLFMSPEAIYLLVVDLTKELSDPAQSYVKVDGHNEERASSPECEDTNLDSITRYSYR